MRRRQLRRGGAPTRRGDAALFREASPGRSRAGSPGVGHAAGAAVTLDGTAVSLGCNIESAAEVAAALEAGADNIGLVRTELAYLDRPALPSEDEQYADAVEILRAAAGRLVTFRTLDVGGDKLPMGVRIAVGPNPALGMRGIRFSLDRPDIFRTQLRALYRASAVGPLRIMLPLVSRDRDRDPPRQRMRSFPGSQQQ